MMGRQTGDQAGLFYEFRLADRIPKDHLLRRINVVVGPVLDGVRGQLKPYYSQIGRPSIDPELMIRMLIVGYCFGLRSERRLTQEVELHLAYRWFCRLDLDDKVPHHSTLSENRLHRFRESDVFRQLFESVVAACMAAGLVKGEGFAVDASVMEANASRYHGKAPDEIVWAEPERQTRAVREYLAGLDAENEPNPDRKPPKGISPSDPCSAWTAKANKRVQFGYGLNYLVDTENAVIVDVEPTPARTYDEVESTKTMLDRTERRLNLKPKRLAADASSSHGMNVSASRCVLLTSRSTTDLNACGFEGCPARVTNSISPLSYRTLRPWRSVPSGHPLHPSSPQQRENPRTDQVTATAGTGSKSHPTVQSKAPTDKTATFSTASTQLRRACSKGCCSATLCRPHFASVLHLRLAKWSEQVVVEN